MCDKIKVLLLIARKLVAKCAHIRQDDQIVRSLPYGYFSYCEKCMCIMYEPQNSVVEKYIKNI